MRFTLAKSRERPHRVPASKRPRQNRSEKRRLDIRDVAKHARVSIATVSRTINSVPSVDKQLAERVWKAIGELNYFPNTQARALVSGRTRLLGLLISEITNPFFPELIEGFEEIAVAHGYEILIGSTNYDLGRMTTCIRRMLERHVEGVAVMTFGIEQPLLEELSSRDIPMVFVDAGPHGPLVRTLVVDYRKGIQEGVQHLAALGHRNIAFISGPLRQGSAQARKAAFIESIEEAGLEANPEWLVEGNHTLEGGMRTMKHLLSLKDLPTAIMCSNDMTAIGALRVLAGAGLKVPKEMSVIGFDDIHMAEFVYPPLTTVRMSRKDLARGAFESLRSVAESLEPSQQRQWTIPTRLIVRQSTSHPPGSALNTHGSKRKAAQASSPKKTAKARRAKS
jgi:DNA-binding LacI/PurR family transcriptional regulator